MNSPESLTPEGGGHVKFCSVIEKEDFPRVPNVGQPQVVLVGGFLGAGKTTLIGELARWLEASGRACGVVTNDQAGGLVDTSSMRKGNGQRLVSEVAGGCFCCKLEELVDRLGRIKEELELAGGAGKASGLQTRSPQAAPVIIAEPVGSCTDLMATVVLPLERTFAVEYAISPLSVVLDGRRALASLGGKRLPGVFSKDVGYIYRKQIEEAEILVVNKRDVMSEEDLADLEIRIGRDYPGKEVFTMSARTGEGVEAWMNRILVGRAAPKKLMEVDYARYADGEACLGWLNAEGLVAVPGGTDADRWLMERAKEVADRLAAEGLEVAHFKMALRDEEGRMGTVNQVVSGLEPDISRPFGGGFSRATLTVNLRAEGDPDLLKGVIETVFTGQVVGVMELAAFRPGEPRPTARVLAV